MRLTLVYDICSIEKKSLRNIYFIYNIIFGSCVSCCAIYRDLRGNMITLRK